MKQLFPFRVPTLSRSFVTLVGLLLLGLPCLPVTRTAHAQVPITSSGLNTAVSAPTTLPSGQTQYDITGGTRAGTNLFHSFGDFNVPTNNIANFLNNSGLATSNILGRVTGGSISSIYGTIQTTGFGSANLFLMNPAGFLFGPNANVNVGGMVAFTTADYLRLQGAGGDGTFYANPAANSVLTSSPVAAYGFLGPNPAAINFVGGQLTVAGDNNGTGVTLVGGNISLTPDTSVTPNVPSSITAPGRSIQITSVAGPGEVAADTGIPAAGMALGTITLGQGTTLSTVGDPSFGDGSGGAVSIRGGQLVATGATILTNFASGTTGHGGDVTIVTTGSAAFTNSTIDTRTIDPQSASVKGGDAGAVSMTASDLTLTNSLIYTGVSGNEAAASLSTGAGGAVTLNGSDSVTLTHSAIETSTANSNGNAGAVTVIAPTVTLETNSGISTVVNGKLRTTANGGSVTLGGPQTTSLSITNSAVTTDSSETEGNAGSVTITGQTVMVGGDGFGFQAISTNTHHSPDKGPFPTSGNAGDIEINGTTVTFTNAALLQSVADSPGTFSRGGNISVNGAQSILLDNGTIFTTTTVSEGNAGNIQLTSPHVTVTGGSGIGSGTEGGGGSSGTITVTGTENIAIDGGSLITTVAGPDSRGSAGQIVLNTPDLTITGGSAVANQNFGTGDGGTITMQGINGPAQSVLISDGSFIFTNTDIGTGPGSSIFVNAHSFTLQNGSVMFAGTNGAGNGGNILVKADSVSVTEGSQITSASLIGDSGEPPTGNAGNITIQGLASPAQSVLIDGAGSGIFTDTQGTGAGGNILVNANSVTLQNGGSLSATTSGTDPSATGGIITVNADTFSLTSGGTMTAASTGPGASGEVVVQGLASPAQSILIDGPGSGIFTNTSGTGAGGDIHLSANSVTLSDGGTLSAATSGTDPSATGGMITITANQVQLNSAATITSATSGPGNAGDVFVNTDTLNMSGGATITASSTGSGAAGNVTIEGLASPAQSVLIDGAGSGIFTDTDGTGPGGDIHLSANSVTLRNGGTLSATTSGPASTATGGTILVEAETVTLATGGHMTTASTGAGASGEVDAIGLNSSDQSILPAQSILIDGSGSGIFTNTSGTGTGGDIHLLANSVTLENGGTLSAATSGTASTATGGVITVNANTVALTSGGTMTASSTGAGAGGEVIVQGLDSTPQSLVPAQSILIDGQGSGIFTNTSGTGAGGDLHLSANSVALQNGGQLSSSSTGTGIAGNITINAGNQFAMTNASVTTEADHSSGGAIKITTNPNGTVQLTDSIISASVLDGTGGGGSVNIDPQFVILQNSQILANAVFGPGGNISITTNLLLADPNSVISASSQFGVNGTVTIQSPNAPASGKIIPLSQKPLIATALLSQRCAALAGGEFSSFTLAGRESLPAEPGGWLSSPLALATLPAGTGQEAIGERETPVVSLRHIAPPGFLTQAFAADWSAGCAS